MSNKTSINIKQLIDQMEIQDDSSLTFYDLLTGDYVYVSEDEMYHVESLEDDEIDSEMKLILDILYKDQYIRIPTKFDIHDYNIMETFSKNYPDTSIGNILYEAIKGKGAFRKFKETLRSLEKEEEWYKHLEKAYKNIAITWCEEHHIKY